MSSFNFFIGFNLVVLVFNADCTLAGSRDLEIGLILTAQAVC